MMIGIDGKGGKNMSGLNQSSVKILGKLIKSGFVTEKQIVNMSIPDLLKLPKITPGEIQEISEMQRAIKAGSLLSFLVSGDEISEVSDEI